MENSQLNESEEVERLKKQLPENIIMLMMQPRREIDFSEENEPLDNEHKLRLLIRQGSVNEKEGSFDDDQILQNAIAAKHEDLDNYFGTIIEAKAKPAESMGSFIIESKSRGKMFWDILIMMYAMYNAFMIPIEVAYSGTFFSAKTKNALTYFGYAVDFCFLIDIVISFRTSYLDPNKGVEVKDPRLIATRYLKSGLFFLDVVSTVPIDNIIKYFLSSRSVKQLSLLGLIKLTRLIRLRKIIAFLNVNQGFKVGARFT